MPLIPAEAERSLRLNIYTTTSRAARTAQRDSVSTTPRLLLFRCACLLSECVMCSGGGSKTTL